MWCVSALLGLLLGLYVALWHFNDVEDLLDFDAWAFF
jgi:hypothetical protein